MKKLLMMLFAATIAVTAVQAQDGRNEMKQKSPEEKAQMMTAKMQKNLALTDDQANQLNQIHLEQARKMADIRERNKDNRDAVKAEMKAIKDETEKRYASVLSKEQLAKKDALKKERKEKMKGQKGEHRGNHHPKKTDKK